MAKEKKSENIADPTVALNAKIKEVEDELAKTKYNKHTQGHIGRLKAKLAQLKAAKTRGGGKKGWGYGLKKKGDATVIMVGFPSVGKSTLLNAITNAESKVGAYDFTTITVVPGVLEYNGAKIQMLDVPGVITEGASGKGRGREILAVVRNADLILLILDPRNPGHQLEVMKNELYQTGIRLNQKRPDVRIVEKNTGGLRVRSSSKKLDGKTAKGILQELKVLNADIIIGKNVDTDDLIDAFMKNRVYLPALFVLNKSDMLDKAGMAGQFSAPDNFIKVSATEKENVDRLKEMIWGRLGLTRIYLKKIGKKPDLKEPMIIKKEASGGGTGSGITVTEICRRIHGDLVAKLEYAKIWGTSVKFDGQRVGVDWQLADKDVVELHF
jgi:small GTP-binding protein